MSVAEMNVASIARQGRREGSSNAFGLLPSAHVDTFARDNLPPSELWPTLCFELPELRYPRRLNCAGALLDGMVAAGLGERTALITPSESLSYRALMERANRIAQVLIDDLGLVPGNRVLLRGYNCAWMAAAWLGVVKAGMIAVPTMPLLRARELGGMVDKAQVTAALCDYVLSDELELTRALRPALDKVVYWGGYGAQSLEALTAAKPAEFENCDTAADDVCLIAFTSGTTGVPKGTMHFHRDILAICDCFPRSCLRVGGNEIFCGTPPLAFTFGLGGLLLFPLRHGASALLLEKPTPSELLRAIQDFSATTCFTAPTFYRQMADMTEDYDLSSLRTCISAGEGLPLATRELWREKSGIVLIDGIGATEMLHIFISAPRDATRPGATGKPIPGYQACILDDQGQPLPVGAVGRLAVRGPTGCRYLADDRQAAYVQHGWNITGDAYMVDADGYYWYQARTDDMIVSAGYNIAGPEVESALFEHEAVAECAVIGVPDEVRGQVVKAFVVLRPDFAPDGATVEALQDYVKRTIAPYKYPRQIEFRSSLPRTDTGKLQRFRLREPA